MDLPKCRISVNTETIRKNDSETTKKTLFFFFFCFRCISDKGWLTFLRRQSPPNPSPVLRLLVQASLKTRVHFWAKKQPEQRVTFINQTSYITKFSRRIRTPSRLQDHTPRAPEPRKYATRYDNAETA